MHTRSIPSAGKVPDIAAASVPDDIVRVRPGDIIPADVKLLT